MTYQVKTAVFEGPLDLLLQLITRHQVDITQVSLVDLVTEYLAYLDEMRQLELEVTSEFLLIAATLIQLKARHLLPDDTDFDLDEELALMEERDRLLSRLLACVTFKDVAAVIAHRLADGGRHLGRTVGLEDLVAPVKPDVKVPIDREGLARIAANVLAAVDAEPDLDHLALDLPSVEEAMADLRRQIEDVAEGTFQDLVDHCRRPGEVVAYFLALLELARWGLVEVSQPDWLSDIWVRHRPEVDGSGLTSEWAR